MVTIIKKILLLFFSLILIFLFILCFQQLTNTTDAVLLPKEADSLRIATYNVHYIRAGAENGEWSVSDWNRRKEPLSDAVEYLDADIIAFQEMESFSRGSNTENLTLDWLKASHPDYSVGAVGDPDFFASTQPIFYKRDAFNLLEQGWFFFSEAPDVLYSRTFNGSFPAFASWVRLQDLDDNSTIYVVNVHTDFSSYTNRIKSLELVAERVSSWINNNETVVVTGDYNARSNSPVLKGLRTLGLSFARSHGSTYHFNKGLHLFDAIDHVGYSEALDPLGDAVVIQKKFREEWPTDHHPVVVDFKK